MKFRSFATLEIPTDEVCRLLTEAVCTSFSPFENLEVYRITRTDKGKFRIAMGIKAARLAAVPKRAAGVN